MSARGQIERKLREPESSLPQRKECEELHQQVRRALFFPSEIGVRARLQDRQEYQQCSEHPGLHYDLYGLPEVDCILQMLDLLGRKEGNEKNWNGDQM